MPRKPALPLQCWSVELCLGWPECHSQRRCRRVQEEVDQWEARQEAWREVQQEGWQEQQWEAQQEVQQKARQDFPPREVQWEVRREVQWEVRQEVCQKEPA